MKKLQDQILYLGIVLNIYDQHLSSLQFADDAICMIGIFVLELDEFGVIVNPNKTKLLTTELYDYDFVFLQYRSKIDVIRDHASHKWLRKLFDS